MGVIADNNDERNIVDEMWYSSKDLKTNDFTEKKGYRTKAPIKEKGDVVGRVRLFY